MKNWMKRAFSVLLIVCMVLSMAACSKSGEEKESAGSGTGGATPTAGSGVYTYTAGLGDVSTWSPTDWSMTYESTILGYTTTTFYTIEMNETKDGYIFVPSAASEMPVDVTAEYAGNELYGVPADATEGYAWRIELNEKLCWEDGTPITADDYLYTMEQYLSPEMKNFRASTFYEGTAALANAKAFYDGSEATYNNMNSAGISLDSLVKGSDGVYTDEVGNIAYLGWTAIDNYWLGGEALIGWADYFDEASCELLSSLVNDDGYVPLTDEARACVESVIVDSWGDDFSAYCYVYKESAPWTYQNMNANGLTLDSLTLGDDGVYRDAEGNQAYLGWTAIDNYWLGGYALIDWADYFDEASCELLSSLANEDGYVPLTDEARACVESVITDSWGDAFDAYCFVYKQGEAVDFSSVGLIKNDDYSLTFVMTKPVSQTDFCLNVYCELVKKDLYEANKKDAGGLIKSTYGTSADAYMSYGPYRIVSYQADKEMKLTKNENWYGWAEGEYYADKYQTTDIDLQKIDDTATQFSLFLQGKMSAATLTADQITTYSNSDYLYYSPDSYVFSLFFNTDVEALKAEDGNGVNHSILSILDFRKAISLCMNRQDFSQYMWGYEPTYGLLNDIYICSLDSGIKYRGTEQAEQALCDLYGVDDVDQITGYDLDAASELFQSAYEQAIELGLMSETDKVQIDYHSYGSDTVYQSQSDFFMSSIQAACKGTDLEGKVTINMVTDENNLANMRAGVCDMILTSWGGAETDPYWMMLCYCTADYNLTYGYDVDTQMMTINVDGEDVTMSASDWYAALHETTYATADLDTRNTILAGIERQILEYYGVIPLSATSYATLYSQRIVLGSENYINSLVGYGGLSVLTYTMDDAQWEEYCASKNYSLTY